MEYDPTRPLVRDQATVEKYFDMETFSMAMEGYADRREAAVLRKRAILFLLEYSQKERDVFIPFLALSYFDRFSSRETLRVEDLELAVVCCLFLASKMRNDSFSVHLILTTRPDLNINEKHILEMEARILSALEWGMRSVNALGFVGYFIEMIPDDLRPSPRIVKEVIIQAEGDIDFTRYRPSVIAASAVFIASSIRFPEKINKCFVSFSSCKHINMGDLNRCIEMIQKFCRKKINFIVTSQAGEASSSSSSAFQRLGKEPVPEISETIEEVIPRRPGKEPVVEDSEVISEELKTVWMQFMEEVRRVLGKAQEISEIMEEPQPGSENEYFELKWISDDNEVKSALNSVAEPEGDPAQNNQGPQEAPPAPEPQAGPIQVEDGAGAPGGGGAGAPGGGGGGGGGGGEENDPDDEEEEEEEEPQQAEINENDNDEAGEEVDGPAQQPAPQQAEINENNEEGEEVDGPAQQPAPQIDIAEVNRQQMDNVWEEVFDGEDDVFHQHAFAGNENGEPGAVDAGEILYNNGEEQALPQNVQVGAINVEEEQNAGPGEIDQFNGEEQALPPNVQVGAIDVEPEEQQLGPGEIDNFNNREEQALPPNVQINAEPEEEQNLGPGAIDQFNN